MMSDKQKKFGIAGVLIIICAVAFYFLYWTKTPVYSINLIREAWQNHDTVGFQQRVDMDRLYTKAFDDYIKAQETITGEKITNVPLAAGLLEMLKPAVVNKLKTETLNAITEQSAQVQPSTTSGKQDQLAKSMQEKANAKDNVVKDVSTINQEGKAATVAITLHNAKLDKDFKLNVTMNELDDGTWKLIEVANLTDFLIEVDKAEKEKLAELNKPISEELNKSLQITGGQMNLRNDGNPFFTSHWLTSNATFNNNSDKDIKSFNYKIRIDESKNGPTLGTYNVSSTLSIPKGQSGTDYKRIDLNPFKDADKAVIGCNFSTTNLTIEITSIEFADGSKLELLTKVPDVTSIKK